MKALKEYNAKRDFKKTAEPEGAVYPKKTSKLAFVVQKHEASHLHYDIRLELDGVMKSWACPKGPSFDPSVKRLAVEVEDHPTSYNSFEGTIPSGEYGGGTVMVWDQGYYTVDEAGKDDDPESLMREGLMKGKLAFTFHGQKLKGSFALVRTRMTAKKPQWLLIKHKDKFAGADFDPVAEEARSAQTNRTMGEIEGGSSSSKTVANSSKKKIGTSNKSATSSALKPMLLHVTPDLPEGKEWVYEQKLDGVRLLAYADENNWAIISRLGNNKSQQFPELGAGLKKIAKATGGPLILDGEVVALDKKGKVLGFQELQGRIHLDDDAAVASEIKKTPVAFYVFDALLVANTAIVDRPWTERRQVIDQIFESQKFPKIFALDVVSSARTIKGQSLKGGWEGVIAKDKNSLYVPGLRTKNWLKWKTIKREELLIGGYTEPKGSRKLIGSLLLGYYDDAGAFVFAGHVGSGLSGKDLKDVHAALKRIEIKKPAFKKAPIPNDTPHWVKPEIVAEVKFQEWTSDHILRQATFLGIRDDKAPEEIRASADSLRITHPEKIVFPKDKITKADLIEYYRMMSPYILPWMKDRPLVLRRFPNGIDSKDFYQQAPDDEAPGRIVAIKGDQGETQKRFVGGDLTTLLYTIQMGCISYDPWHSRVQSLEYPDYTIIDLDPIKGTSFETVRSVALAVLDSMDELGLHGSIKTSGATGLHIYLPLPPETSLETARLVAELICTQVAETHPHGTVERAVKKRKKGSVYLDSQQNYLSKSVAGVWAVRAKPTATVSTPITRKELAAGVVPQDFTIKTVVKEAKKRSAIWMKGMAKPNDLSALGGVRD